MRIDSDRPLKNGGHFHHFQSDMPPPDVNHRFAPKQIKVPAVNFAQVHHTWRRNTSTSEIDDFARSLDLDPAALRELGAARAPEHRAWAFPMKNETGHIIGIRLRGVDGRKWAVRGSKSGLFIPETLLNFTGCLFICEGPTDTAALLGIGLFAIGRPACLGCETVIVSLVDLLAVRECVIVTDNDGPGIRGAEKLAGQLRRRTTFFIPPAKDAREFVKAGGTAALVFSMLKNSVWKTAA